MRTRNRGDFWLNRMLSVDKQVLVGFGLAIVFLLTLGWIFFTTTSRFVDNSREAIFRAELIAPVRRIFTLTSEAESLQRAYLLTAADFYLERRQEALQELKRTFQWLYAHAQARGYLRWVERARKLEELADKRIALLDEVLARDQSNAESARDLLAVDAGREQMGALQTEVESWLSEQQRILDNRARAAERTGAHILIVFFIALGFGVTGLLVLMYFIQRALQKRESTHVALIQSEAQLQESEQRLRAFSESLELKVAARTADLQRQAMRLQRLTGELIFAEQRERKRLAAILHDDLQQLLVAAQLRLGQARHQADDPGVLSAIENATELLAKALDASRTLTYQLRPAVLHEGSFVSALRWLASEASKLHALDVVIDAEDTEPALSEEFRVMIFESVRELLFNVAKHAGVNEATVRVRCQGEDLQVTVEDKGVGFDIDGVAKEKEVERGGLGLFSTRERLAALGGDMIVESSPGAGTSVRVTAPLLGRSEHSGGRHGGAAVYR